MHLNFDEILGIISILGCIGLELNKWKIVEIISFFKIYLSIQIIPKSCIHFYLGFCLRPKLYNGLFFHLVTNCQC